MAETDLGTSRRSHDTVTDSIELSAGHEARDDLIPNVLEGCY